MLLRCVAVVLPPSIFHLIRRLLHKVGIATILDAIGHLFATVRRLLVLLAAGIRGAVAPAPVELAFVFLLLVLLLSKEALLRDEAVGGRKRVLSSFSTTATVNVTFT